MGWAARSVALVGRERELDALGQAVDTFDLVIVKGIAGIGKSSLVDEALATLAPTRLRCVAALSRRPRAALAGLGTPPAAAGSALTAWLVEQVPSGLLVADDFHLADADTQAAVESAVGQLTCVVVMRAGDRTAWELEQRLARRSDATVVELGPLTDTASVELAMRAGASASDAARIARETAGHPYWIFHSSTGPPASSVAHAVAATLDRVSPAARTAVAALAVLGRPASPNLVGQGLDEAVGAGLVIVPGGSSHAALAHALVGEVAIARTADADLVALHAALASRLDDPSEQARHHAAAGEVAAAVRAARRAIEAPSDPWQQMADVALLAELTGDDADLAAAASFACAQGRFGEAIEWAERVEHDSPAFGRAALAAAVSARSTGLDPRPWLEATAPRPGPSALDGTTARRLAVERFLAAPHDRDGIAADEMLAACRGSSDEPWARIAVAAATIASGAGGWEAELQDAIAAARADDAAGDLAHGLWLYTRAAAAAGDLLAASRLAAQGAELATSGGLAAWAARFTDERDWCAAVAVSTPPLGPIDAAAAICLADAGQIDAARSLATRSLGELARPRDRRTEAVLACIAWYDHDNSAGSLAVDALDGAADPVVRWLAAPVAAWTGDLGGDVPAALATERDAVRLMANDGARAAVSFRTARDQWSVIAARGEVRCAWAAAQCAAIGSGGDATGDALADAAARSVRTGVHVFDARIAAVGRSIGLTEARRRSDSTVLTAREVDVLDCVAAGLSSAKIARRLGIAPATVAAHVRSSIVKLGAANRREAAAMLAASRVDPR